MEIKSSKLDKIELGHYGHFVCDMCGRMVSGMVRDGKLICNACKKNLARKVRSE